jgi:hypothetical protein
MNAWTKEKLVVSSTCPIEECKYILIQRALNGASTADCNILDYEWESGVVDGVEFIQLNCEYGIDLQEYEIALKKCNGICMDVGYETLKDSPCSNTRMLLKEFSIVKARRVKRLT